MPRPAPRRIAPPTVIRLWHLLSLDAPTVAVVWSVAFAWAAGIQLPPWVPVLLALVTWSVYIGDRLLDARTGLRARHYHQLRQRHIFHWHHRHTLLPVAIAAALAAAAILLVSLPPIARAPDSLLAAATLAYFSGVHSRRRAPVWLAPFLSKEFLVGLLFTLGCALPAFTRLGARSASTLWPFAALIAFFIALAWLNCHAIARWEAHPPAIRTGVFLRAAALALASLLLASLVLPEYPRIAALFCATAAAACLLALLDRYRSRITPLFLRAAADLVLLTPALLIPFLRIAA